MAHCQAVAEVMPLVQVTNLARCLASVEPLGAELAVVDTGSTVLVVEHDTDTIRAADHLVELGPTGGRGGGRILAEGPPEKVLQVEDAPTARALREPAVLAGTARGAPEKWVELKGARANNLKCVDLRIPKDLSHHFRNTVMEAAQVQDAFLVLAQAVEMLVGARRETGAEAASPIANSARTARLSPFRADSSARRRDDRDW